MSDDSSGPTSGPVASRDEPDWTQQVTDLIVDSVDKIRDRTTGPILDYTHASVHAVVAAIVLLPIAVLGSVGLVRFLDWAIPGDVWIVYAILSAVLWLTGVLLWSQRTPKY